MHESIKYNNVCDNYWNIIQYIAMDAMDGMKWITMDKSRTMDEIG